MGLFTSGSVGGYDYVHYWFKNSNLTPQDFLNERKQSLTRQYSNFKDERKIKMVSSGDINEGFQILDDIASGSLIGNKLAQGIQQYFQSNNTSLATGASDSGLGKSYAEIGALIRKGATAGLAAQLVQSAGQCQQQLNNFLDDIVEIFAADYPRYVDLAVQGAVDYLNSHTYQEIINSFMTSGYKFVELSNNDIRQDHQNIIQSIARLWVAVNAIPMLNSSAVSASEVVVTHSHSKTHKVGNKSELISVFFGKVGGILSGLSGMVEEIAVGHGLEYCIKLMGEKILEVTPSFEGGNLQLDPNIKEDANRELATGTYNKGDVTLTITTDKVTLDFGVSVKTSKKVNSNNIPKEVKLHDETNLLEVFKMVQNEGVSAYYIYNLAGGLDQGEYLATAWKSLVNYAVATNFIDYLAGRGFNSANNNLVLVANRQIYSISEIIKKVSETPDAILYNGGKQRAQYWHINRDNWQDATDDIDVETAAEYRSAHTILDLTNKFRETKMRISLNLAMLF